VAIFWITSLALGSLAASGQATPSPTFEGISERAAAALKANQLEEAVRLYRQAVGMHSGWSEGWGYLAATLSAAVLENLPRIAPVEIS
jgi:hypothetical protein